MYIYFICCHACMSNLYIMNLCASSKYQQAPYNRIYNYVISYSLSNWLANICCLYPFSVCKFMHNIHVVEISDACNMEFYFLLIGNLICIYELGTLLDEQFLWWWELKLDNSKEPAFGSVRWFMWLMHNFCKDCED